MIALKTYTSINFGSTVRVSIRYSVGDQKVLESNFDVFKQIEQGSAQEVERQLLTKRALLIIDLAQRIFKQLSIEEISIRECAIAMRAYLFLHTVEGTHKNGSISHPIHFSQYLQFTFDCHIQSEVIRPKNY